MAIKPRPIALVRFEDSEGRARTAFTCHTEQEIAERVSEFENLFERMPEWYVGCKILVGRISWDEV